MPGEAHGAFCGQHKMKDMERVNTRRCSADGCDKRASFNDPGAPTYPLPFDLTACALTVHFCLSRHVGQGHPYWIIRLFMRRRRDVHEWHVVATRVVPSTRISLGCVEGFASSFPLGPSLDPLW